MSALILSILKKTDQTNSEEIISALKKALENETSLHLAGEDINPVALGHLAKALEDNTTLTHLATTGDQITNQIAKVLESNTTLTSLELRGGDLTDEALDSLFIALTKNQNLTQLLISSSSNPNVMAKLGHLLEENQSPLTDLVLQGNIKQLAIALGNNHTFKKLNIAFNPIDDEAAKNLAIALQKHPNLNQLNMNWTTVKTKETTKRLTDALQENQTITHVSYAGNNLHSTGFDGISQFVPLLATKTWTYLNLGSNNLDHTDISTLNRGLKKNKSLTELNLSDNKIGSKSAKKLAKILKENIPPLISLDLESDHIEDEGIEALSNALADNTQLKKLNLRSNSAGPKASRALTNALKKNHTLNSLNLSHTLIDVKILSEALAQNEGLTELELISNRVNGSSLETLAVALQKNHSLTSLDIGYNGIRNEGILTVIKLIKNTPKLEKLGLQANSITSSGIKLLATFLETNQSLTSLNLRENLIDIEGFKVLTEALKKNSSLTEVNLTAYKFVGPQINAAYKAIEELLEVNKTITTLYVPYPPSRTSQKAYENIQQALKRNQIIAKEKEEERIALLRKEIEEIVPGFRDPAGIIVDYAGAPPKTRPTIEPSEPPEPIREEQPSSPPSPSIIESQEPTPPVDQTDVVPPSDKTTKPSAPAEPESKSLSIFSKIRDWFREKWNNLTLFIHNAISTLKNKFASTPKTGYTSPPSSSTPVKPEQTVQATDPKAENRLQKIKKMILTKKSEVVSSKKPKR